MKYPTKITFFEWLTPRILEGQKTITIRDEFESHYGPGTRVEVFTLETDRKVCDIEIESVEPISFDDINEIHAQQEFMKLSDLRQLIKEIYPDKDRFFVISFKLIK